MNALRGSRQFRFAAPVVFPLAQPTVKRCHDLYMHSGVSASSSLFSFNPQSGLIRTPVGEVKLLCRFLASSRRLQQHAQLCLPKWTCSRVRRKALHTATCRAATAQAPPGLSNMPWSNSPEQLKVTFLISHTLCLHQMQISLTVQTQGLPGRRSC